MKTGRCILWSTMLVVAGSMGVTGMARPAYASSPAGVHVCTQAHFSQANVFCLQDDSQITLAQFSTARLAWGTTGPYFSSATTTIMLSHVNNIGNRFEVGSISVGESLAANLSAVPLAYVFAKTGAQGLGYYAIEVDNGNTLIGVHEFAVVASAGSPPVIAPVGNLATTRRTAMNLLYQQALVPWLQCSQRVIAAARDVSQNVAPAQLGNDAQQAVTACGQALVALNSYIIPPVLLPYRRVHRLINLAMDDANLGRKIGAALIYLAEYRHVTPQVQPAVKLYPRFLRDGAQMSTILTWMHRHWNV